ncbi:MAG: cytidylate kinase [Burkholderiales bacterium]|jgi:cytidylate kinase|nr:cytidylate kinase [Burkholderiales bacterium]
MAVITIDGPASSGKGTVAKKVAGQLGFHYLDSGAIYRALGLMVINAQLKKNDIDAILNLIDKMKLSFTNNGRVILNSQDVTEIIRSENVGMMASDIAKISEIRSKLHNFQQGFNQPPGLVTDGRDMGSVIFPQAELKVFLTASVEKRASRRYSQLHKSSDSVTIAAILCDIMKRDKQDCERSSSPLTYDHTFKVLDNTDLSIEETVQTIINWYNLSGKC